MKEFSSGGGGGVRPSKNFDKQNKNKMQKPTDKKAGGGGGGSTHTIMSMVEIWFRQGKRYSRQWFAYMWSCLMFFSHKNTFDMIPISFVKCVCVCGGGGGGGVWGPLPENLWLKWCKIVQL